MKNKRSNKDIFKIILVIFGGFFLFSFILCMGIIGSFADNSDNSEKKTSEDYKIENNTKSKIIKEKAKITVKETPTKKPTIKPTKKPTVKPTKKINMLDLQLNILRKNFDGVADIKYKKEAKLIEIMPTDPSFMYEANQAYNQDPDALIIWNQLIENIKGISKEIDDKEICICIVNNLNTENYLLMIMDGTVLYNFADL